MFLDWSLLKDQETQISIQMIIIPFSFSSLRKIDYVLLNLNFKGFWILFVISNDQKASLVAQMVKNLPAVQKTWVWDLGLIPGQEDLLEKGMATHSSILASRIPWAEDS